MNLVYDTALCVSIAIVIYLAAFTLTRSDGAKRSWYVGVLGCVFLFLLGSLMGALSTTTEGAFMGTRVEYLGSATITSAILLFVADYCKLKIHRAVKVLLWAMSFTLIALLWTTEYHGLIYADFVYVQNASIGRLSITPGPLHLVIHIYTALGMGFSLAVLFRQYFVWDKSHRRNVLLLIFGILTPVTVNIMYFLGVFSFNPTPIALTVACFLFFLNTVIFNMLDIVPAAMRLALQSIKEAFVVVDTRGGFVHVNDTARRLFPELAALQSGQPMGLVAHWPLKDLDDYNANAPIAFEIPENNHFIANICPVFDEKARLIGRIVLIQDVTESVRLTKRLEEMAHTDALTGIFNRRQFMNLACKEVERAARTGEASYFVLFDIDHFKEVNDTYGHLAGDKVLSCVAERVSKTIRPYDLFGRYGGEEFILYVSGIAKLDMVNHTERIRLAICETPMEFADLDLKIDVSASFGVAPVTAASSIESIINHADEALYKAKTGGRNRVVMGS